jgi:hypothetical protein
MRKNLIALSILQNKSLKNIDKCIGQISKGPCRQNLQTFLLIVAAGERCIFAIGT